MISEGEEDKMTKDMRQKQPPTNGGALAANSFVSRL